MGFPPAGGSSHREAPFIAQMPAVDATDFYMFRSYEPGRDGFVTLIADFNPLLDPFGGPNYFALDSNAVYDVHVDSSGDGVEDLTFRLTFGNTLRGFALPVGGMQVPVPLINLGPVLDGVGRDALNRFQSTGEQVARLQRRAEQQILRAATETRDTCPDGCRCVAKEGAQSERTRWEAVPVDPFTLSEDDCTVGIRSATVETRIVRTPGICKRARVTAPSVALAADGIELSAPDPSRLSPATIRGLRELLAG